MDTKKVLTEQEIKENILYKIIENIQKQLDELSIRVNDIKLNNEQLSIIQLFSIKDGHKYNQNMSEKQGYINTTNCVETIDQGNLRKRIYEFISNDSIDSMSDELKLMIYRNVTNMIRKNYGKIIQFKTATIEERIDNVLFIRDMKSKNDYEIRITIPYIISVDDLYTNNEDIKISISSDKRPMSLECKLKKIIKFNIQVK